MLTREQVQFLQANAAPVQPTRGRARFVNGQFVLDDEPQQKKKDKGFLVDSISAGGGMAGAAAGAAGGAALGSIVPGVGTVIGGLLGAVLGGAGGSAGGQVLENKVAGDDLMTGVGQEALLGGVTSIGPVRALTLGKALATGAGKEGIEKAITATPVRDFVKRKTGIGAGDDVLKTSMAGKVQEAGNKALLDQYGTISKPVARVTRPMDTVSELANVGITKPMDAERIASAVTGSSGILNRQVAKAVGDARAVDTSTLRQVFSDSLDNYGIVDKDRKSLQTLFDAQMKRISGGARGSLDPKVNPTEALDMMKSIEKRIANLEGRGGNYRLSTPERGDQANVLRLVRDELEDQIYRGAGANDNLQTLLTPQLREELVSLMPKNAKWAKYVDDNIMKATDVSALRSAQRPFVNISQIINEADTNAMTFGGRSGNATLEGSIPSMVARGTINAVRNPVARAGAAVSRRATNTNLGSGGVTPMNSAGRVLAGNTLMSALNQQPQEAPIDAPALEGELMDPGMAETAMQPTNQFGVTSQQLQQAMMAALMNNDKEAFQQLQAMSELVAASEASSAPQLNSTQAASVSKAATAVSALDRLEQLFGNAGGGGLIQGGIAGALGAVNLNNEARTYNNQLAATARLLGRAMGETGAGSDADAQAFISMLPQLTDSPEVAQMKLAELRARLQDSQNNLLYYGGGASEQAQGAI